MQRLTSFLKQMFAAPDQQALPATAFEMTLHDALRIRSGRVLNDRRPELRQIGVCRYYSESDLYHQWHRLDHSVRQTANLTVILVLSDFLRSNLREIIRRPRLAHRLVIVPHSGHWPGINSFGDLALSAGSLGWNSIELCRDFYEAPFTSCQDEQLILVLPPNTPVRSVI